MYEEKKEKGNFIEYFLCAGHISSAFIHNIYFVFRARVFIIPILQRRKNCGSERCLLLVKGRTQTSIQVCPTPKPSPPARSAQRRDRAGCYLPQNARNMNLAPGNCFQSNEPVCTFDNCLLSMTQSSSSYLALLDALKEKGALLTFPGLY